MSTIAAVAVASPPYIMDQDQVESSVLKHYSERLNARSRAVVDKVFRHPSVLRRRFAFDEPEDLVDEHPDHRIARFTHWGVQLSDRAARDALARVHLRPEDVSAIVVNTCTGYICPGLSTYLVESLGLRRTVLALDLVGSGCGGAVPNLQTCQALLQRHDDPVILCISVEICSSTFQMGDDLSLLVSNALFADGAAAAVLWRRPSGTTVLASANRHAPEHRNDIRYVHKNGQLHNQLSLRLPGIAARAVNAVVNDLLRPQNLTPADIKYWALHPGGGKRH